MNVLLMFTWQRLPSPRLVIACLLALSQGLAAQNRPVPNRKPLTNSPARFDTIRPAMPDSDKPGQTVVRKPAETWMVNQIKTVGEFVDRFNGKAPVGATTAADSADRPATRAQAFSRLFDEDDARLRSGKASGGITYAQRVEQFVEEAAEPAHPFQLPRQVQLYAEVDYRVWLGKQPDTLRVWLAKFYKPDQGAYRQVIGVQKPTRLADAAPHPPAPPAGVEKRPVPTGRHDNVPVTPPNQPVKPQPAATPGTITPDEKTESTNKLALADSLTSPAPVASPLHPEEPGKMAEKPTSGSATGPMATTTTPAEKPAVATATEPRPAVIAVGSPAKADTSNRQKLPPNAHEVDFLPLMRGMLAQKSLLRFAPETVQPDAGWLAVEAALKAGRMTIETGYRTTVFVDTERGWVLRINDLNRGKNNSGWLITNLYDSHTIDPLPVVIRASVNLTKR